MASLKMLLVLLTAVPVSGQWPFSMWRNEQTLDALASVNQAFSQLPSFYHTTADISKELAEKKCKGMKYHAVKDPANPQFGTALDVVTFKDPHHKGKPNHKVLVVAGEHARELIGSEVALQLVNDLCKDSALAARNKTEYMIVVNANPMSRMMVEGGDFCRRTNANGVDLNRNWDDKFATNGMRENPDTNPGMMAFSEPESRILKKLMEDFKPDTFLDVHSGNLGLYLPNQLAKEHKYAKKVESMLVDVNDHNCKCPLGIADEEVQYKTSGSSLDYAYDKVGTKFAVAMEVFVEKERVQKLRERWADQKSKLDTSSTSFLEIEGKELSQHSLMKSEEDLEAAIQQQEPSSCLSMFNPLEKKLYSRVVKKWSTTLIELSMKGRDVPAMKDQSSMLQTGEEGSSIGHIFRIGAVLLLLVGVWFLWQRFSHLFAKNKEAEATPLAQPKAMGPIQVTDRKSVV